MATRASPQLVWGSSWMAFRAERGGGGYHAGNEQGHTLSYQTGLLQFRSTNYTALATRAARA
eukprot:9474130-Alexandrium_andersonii.AAC.1